MHTNFFKLIYLFVFIFGCVGSLSLHAGFLQLQREGGHSVLRYVGFSLWWSLLLWSTGSRRMGPSSCSTRAQQLWLAGSLEHRLSSCGARGPAAPWHVVSPRTRARTRVRLIGRRTPNHCTTRKACIQFFKIQASNSKLRREKNIREKISRS